MTTLLAWPVVVVALVTCAWTLYWLLTIGRRLDRSDKRKRALDAVRWSRAAGKPHLACLADTNRKPDPPRSA